MDPEKPESGSATWLDRGYQGFYWLAYRVLRQWWRLRHPTTRGAFVAVWHQGHILLIQNSYVSFRSIPGGGIARNETPLDAAVRECWEEVGLEIAPDRLRFEYEVAQTYEGKRDTVWVYSVELDPLPELRIDHREVVWAGWVSPRDALGNALFPPVRRHLQQRIGS